MPRLYFGWVSVVLEGEHLGSHLAVGTTLKVIKLGGGWTPNQSLSATPVGDLPSLPRFLVGVR